MNGLQRIPVSLEQRQEVFRELERMRTVPAQMTLFLMLQLITMALLAVVPAMLVWNGIVHHLGGGGLRYFLAAVAAAAAGLAGAFAGYSLFGLLDRFAAHRMKNASDEVLWKRVDWGLRVEASITLALAQLAARGCDVSGVLPQLLKMLNSERSVARQLGFDALRFVYFDEARAITDYNPDAAVADCRAKVERLRELLKAEEAAGGQEKGTGSVLGS